MTTIWSYRATYNAAEFNESANRRLDQDMRQVRVSYQENVFGTEYSRKSL